MARSEKDINMWMSAGEVYKWLNSTYPTNMIGVLTGTSRSVCLF